MSVDITDFNQWRVKNGLPPLRRGGKKKIRSFTVSDEAMTGLEYLAKLHQTTWGYKPSISALIELIGTFGLTIVDENKAGR